MNVNRASAFLVLTLLASAPLRAHDFWIEPSSFLLQPGQKIAVRLRVGEQFVGQPVPRLPELTMRLAEVGPRELPLPGVPNTDPAGFFSSTVPGVHTLIYESGRSPVELDAAKFEAYLAKEGLERIQQLRARRGESASSAKEVFSRCSKAFVSVRGAAPPFKDHATDLPLELIAESSPFSLSSAKNLRVRLLFRGKPLAGAKVTAFSRHNPQHEVVGRTDAQGRTLLSLDSADAWLVKAVHMVEAPPETGAQWESFWAALTFEVEADGSA